MVLVHHHRRDGSLPLQRRGLGEFSEIRQRQGLPPAGVSVLLRDSGGCPDTDVGAAGTGRGPLSPLERRRRLARGALRGHRPHGVFRGMEQTRGGLCRRALQSPGLGRGRNGDYRRLLAGGRHTAFAVRNGFRRPCPPGV